MSQRAKASKMCSDAGYARGGMARPARGPARPKSKAPVAGPSQMPSDIMGAPPPAMAAGAPANPDMAAPPMKRGGMAKAKGC